jgi:hypothetical protein
MVGDEWLEARTTAEGLLQGLTMAVVEPPAGATLHDGVFSLVVDPPTKRLRRLPTMYIRGAPVFAHRDVGPVIDSLHRTIEVVQSAQERPTYALQACRLDGEPGLYGADVYNRSGFRNRLGRLGMNFSNDPYVSLSPEGKMQCTDWGNFEPRFFIIGVGTPQRETIVEMTGAMALVLMSNSRFGQLDRAELHALAGLFSSVRGVGCRDPKTLVDHLRTSR